MRRKFNFTKKLYVILITGGTGLLGSHLLFDLLKKNEKVRVLARASADRGSVRKTFSYYTNQPDIYFDKIEWVEGDINDISSLEEAMEEVNEVYHCAAKISFVPADEKEMIKTNVEGTANVVNVALAKNLKKLCHVSSIAALAMHEIGEPVNEQTFWKSSSNTTAYSISKYGSEREVWRAMEEGLNAVIVNPSVIIGPGNWHRGSSVMFSASYKGLKFYTSGSCGFVDVRDVTKSMIELMNSNVSDERFIISSENISFKHFFELVHQHFGKKKPSIKVGKGLAEFGWRIEKIRAAVLNKPPSITKETARASNQHTSLNNEKIKKAIGIEFIPIEKSVKEICDYYLKDLKTKEPI